MLVVNPKLSVLIVSVPPERKLFGGLSWLWVKNPAPNRGT